MKKLAAAAILILSTLAAVAQHVVYEDGTVRPTWPRYLYNEDGTVATVRPTAEQCIAAGVARWETPAEQADREAAEAAAQAQAEAEAAAQATLPATFPTGIAVTNSAGHWVEFVPDGTNVVAQTLAIQVSQSPLTTEQREAMKAAAMAEREAKKAAASFAKARGNLQERIAALEALQGIK